MLKHSKVFSSFSVDDLEKAKKFYNDIMGMKVEYGAMGLLELQVKEDQAIMVYPKSNHVPATFTVLNFMVKDIDKTVDELTANGIVFEQYGGEIKTDKRGIAGGDNGPRIAWFKDPAGNILSVLQES